MNKKGSYIADPFFLFVLSISEYEKNSTGRCCHTYYGHKKQTKGQQTFMLSSTFYSLLAIIGIK